ncbi:MAG: PIG-L family deacetylase [Acetobacteraceae bacterium]
MPTALFLSPHLDDVAFSCGGLMAQLGDAGWRTVMATAFTASVPTPTGFALACQLDKGLGPEVDYMALRREEDRQAAALLGAEPRWLGLPEAPHRGYGSAPELFAGLRADDAIWRELVPLLADLVAGTGPALILAPQGLGGHVDHLQMIRALGEAGPGAAAIAYYRDAPYAIRNPAAQPLVTGPAHIVPIAAGLDRKIRAACAYASQIGFQFGGKAALARSLTEFALSEGTGTPSERFLGNLPPGPLQP